MDTLEKVREFHEGVGASIPSYPTTANLKQWSQLRLDLIEEEFNELRDAVKDDDHVGILDALIDLQYVLDGAFLQLGFSGMKNAAFEEVHRSNLTKLIDPEYRDDGKLMKGPHYSPPKLGVILEDFKRRFQLGVKSA